MQKISNKPVKTYAIGFEESGYDETDHAKKIAAHLGTDHHEHYLGPKDALDVIPKLPDIYDEPFADTSAIPTMLVSKMAAQHVTVTLSGDGGDELFHGYGSHLWANRLSNSYISAFKGVIGNVLSLGNSRLQRIGCLFQANPNLQAHIFSQEQYLFSDSELTDLLNIELPSPWLPHLPLSKRKLTPAEIQAIFDTKYYLPNDLLTKVDRASMQYSLETRVPLLDHRVLEYSVNLSSDLKIKNGESKYLLKQVLYDYVPKKYFDRPKWGFSIPIRFWLQNELKYLPDKYLSENVLAKYGIFNIAQVKEIERRYFAGEDYLFNKIWAIILLNQWLENN